MIGIAAGVESQGRAGLDKCMRGHIVQVPVRNICMGEAPYNPASQKTGIRFEHYLLNHNML